MKTQQELDSERIAAAIEFLILHRTSHTGLGDVADHVHLSPCHFQRMFQRRVGVSPKQFARFLSVEYAKKILMRPAPRCSMRRAKRASRPRAACTTFSSRSRA